MASSMHTHASARKPHIPDEIGSDMQSHFKNKICPKQKWTIVCLRGLTYQEEYVSIRISRSQLCSFKLCDSMLEKKPMFFVCDLYGIHL